MVDLVPPPIGKEIKPTIDYVTAGGASLFISDSEVDVRRDIAAFRQAEQRGEIITLKPLQECSPSSFDQ